MSPPISDRRLWVTVDGTVVDDGDSAAAFLQCAPGDEIPEGYAAPKAKGKGKAVHTSKPEE